MLMFSPAHLLQLTLQLHDVIGGSSRAMLHLRYRLLQVMERRQYMVVRL